MYANDIIMKWCKEVGIPVSIVKNNKSRTLTLYTQYPNLLAGKGSKFLIKYRRMLKALGWEKVLIKESRDHAVLGKTYIEIKKNMVPDELLPK